MVEKLVINELYRSINTSLKPLKSSFFPTNSAEEGFAKHMGLGYHHTKTLFLFNGAQKTFEVEFPRIEKNNLISKIQTSLYKKTLFSLVAINADDMASPSL